MKLSGSELEEIEARLMRENDCGVQFFPTKNKTDDKGMWEVWHDSNGIRYTEYGKYDEKLENREFDNDVKRIDLLRFVQSNEVTAEWQFDNAETDFEKFAKDNEIVPLREIKFKLPRPLATKFEQTFLSDPEKLYKYILDAIVEAIKDDAEAYAYAE